MSKRDFDCSSSDSSPSDTEVAQGACAQDAEDNNDLSNPVESDSEEEEPSSSPKPRPVKRMKITNCRREWRKYNRLASADHTFMEMMAFIRADLAESNRKAGITSLP